MSINYDLATIWAFLIAFAVFAYVVLDGFDLGIGIIFPAFGVGEERDAAMNAIAPVAAPMPCPAAVTTHTLPFSRIISPI